MKASSSSPSFLGDGLVFVRLRLVLFWANDIRRPRRAVYSKLTEDNENCRRSLLKILTSIFAPLLETAAPWLVSLATVRRLAGKSKLAVPRAFAALAFAISSSSIRSKDIKTFITLQVSLRLKIMCPSLLSFFPQNPPPRVF